MIKLNKENDRFVLLNEHDIAYVDGSTQELIIYMKTNDLANKATHTVLNTEHNITQLLGPEPYKTWNGGSQFYD